MGQHMNTKTVDGVVYGYEWNHVVWYLDDVTSGYSFDCTEDGAYFMAGKPAAARNLAFVLEHPELFDDRGIVYREWAIGRECECGSGQLREPLHDARGIFVSYTCQYCEDAVRARYAPHVFAGYDQAFLDEYSGERIEADY